MTNQSNTQKYTISGGNVILIRELKRYISPEQAFQAGIFKTLDAAHSFLVSFYKITVELTPAQIATLDDNVSCPECGEPIKENGKWTDEIENREFLKHGVCTICAEFGVNSPNEETMSIYQSYRG